MGEATKVNRRIFCQAAAAVAVVGPSLTLPVCKPAIDLTPFCGETFRYDISTPWVSGGWRYASDGRIAVRLATSLPDEPLNVPDYSKAVDGIAPIRRRPNGLTLPWPGGDATDWKPWPEPRYSIAMHQCPDCQGCPACGGDGYIVGEDEEDVGGALVWEVSHIKCKACQGRGWAMGCATCQDEREFPAPCYLWLASDVVIAAEYDRKVRSLPGPIVYRLQDTGIQIRFDGGESLLMPVDSERAREREMEARRHVAQ